MPIGVSFKSEGAIKSSAVESREHEDSLYARRITEIPSNMQLRGDYSSTDGLPDYLGFAARGIATSTTGWLLQKFTYDANRQCTLRQIAYDSWDNRTTATYA